MKKTIETKGTSHNGRKFTHIVNWQDCKITSHAIEYASHDDVGPIYVPVRSEVTTAELWSYMIHGKNHGKKIFAT